MFVRRVAGLVLGVGLVLILTTIVVPLYKPGRCAGAEPRVVSMRRCRG